MNYQLQMTLMDKPAAMERVLQTTRYRGFQIKQMQMSQSANTLEVLMEVYGKQPINILTTQLNKLYDLDALTISPTNTLKMPRTA